MNLFVYGTLLVPEILETVTGVSDLDSVSGTLPEFQIRRVEGGDFPGIYRSPGEVSGRVLLDVPERAMRRLDAYEDTFYLREAVEVQTESGVVTAFAYIVPADKAGAILSDDPWTLEWFESEALEQYWARLFQ